MELGILMAPAMTVAGTLDSFNTCMEQLSPDYVWLADRLLSDDYSKLKAHLGFNFEEPPVEFLDPFSIIIEMMHAPKRPQHFGIAVTDLIRRGPPDLARICHTINQIIDAPLNIGFGAGEAVNLLPLGYGHGPKPVSFMLERLRQFKHINDEGQYISTEGHATRLGYNKLSSPIWIGGQRDRMLQIAAEYADGWLPAWKMTPQEYRQKAEFIAGAADQHKRKKPKLGMFSTCLLGSSRMDLINFFCCSPLLKAIVLQAPGDAWKKFGLEHPAGKGSKGFFDTLISEIDPAKLQAAIDSAPSELISEVMFLGNTQEILAELWEYKQAGVEQLVLMLPFFSGANMLGLPDFYPEFKKVCDEFKLW